MGLQFGAYKKDTETISAEEKAAIHYERAIKHKQGADSIAAAYELSACLAGYPDYRDAGLLLESEIRHFFSRGVGAFENAEYAEAAKWLRLTLKYDPDHSEAKAFLNRAEKKSKE